MDGPIPEDEDEQLKLAIALSLQGADEVAASTVASRSTNPAGREEGDTNTRPASLAGSTASTTQPQAGINSQWSFLGMNRGAMEQQRLARLAHTQNGNSSPAPTLKRQRDKDLVRPASREDHSKRHRAASDTTPKSIAGNNASNIEWPNGAIKQTWCFGFERSGSDVKIEEIIQKDTLQLAVLSSFIWDVEWILSKILPITKLILVMHAKEESTRKEYIAEAGQIPNRQIRLCFPRMDGNVNCMHSKLMLLAHPDHLRVVVPTANLVPFDWGETGVMENTVFTIDLPRHEDGHVDSEADLTFFGQELVHFCRAKGIEEATLRSLGRFDFSATKHMAFVHSIGGEHRTTTERTRTGYTGLGLSVSRLGLQTKNPLRIDIVTSSIGALSDEFLQRLYLACQGDDGKLEYARRTAPKTKSAAKQGDLGGSEAPIDNAKIRDAFNIYFPSDETVRRSRGGPANAGTICFQERWYDAPSFHQRLIRDCQSKRSGVLMHSKILFVQQVAATRDIGESGSSQTAWMYVGSANCSDSAWGRLVKDRVSKEPKLTCRNWECGVLLPVPHASGTRERERTETGLERFASKMMVPMRLPAMVLATNGLRPWFFGSSS